MAHCIVPDAEVILDKPYPVLDKGFVRLVDYLGSDQRIVQSARVSYGEGTKTYREDKGLIDYLLRNDHSSPFEQVIFTFHMKLPIFVARQIVRTRTARLNEISGRYSVMKDEFYMPEPSDIALQSTDNKQGRQDQAVSKEMQKKVLKILNTSYKQAAETYKKLLDVNIARELSRIALPLGLYTEWYWQIDLRNLMNFLKLRLDKHAQKEVRVYAEVIEEIAKTVCPMAMEAFERHIRDGVALSSEEVDYLKNRLSGKVFEISDRSKKILGQKLGAVL
jgi:thymidylate synthase (FAD)